MTSGHYKLSLPDLLAGECHMFQKLSDDVQQFHSQTISMWRYQQSMVRPRSFECPMKSNFQFKKQKQKNTFALEICLQLVISWVSLLKVSCWHIWTLDPGKSSSYLLRSQVTDASNQLANNLCNFPEFLCYHFAFLLLRLGTVSFCMGDQTKDP